MDNNTNDIKKGEDYKPKRFWEIDFLKGFATIFMVIFHFFYLMYFMDIVHYNIKSGVLYSMAKMAHTIFIFAVGINLAISQQKFRAKNKELYKENKTEYNNQFLGKQMKRAFVLIAAGFVMSFLSYLGFGNLFVKFGIFHFIGVAIILTIPIVDKKYMSLAVTGLIIILYYLTNTPKLLNYFSSACHNTPILCFITGVFNVKFSSLDHFSLIPYLGLITFGIFVGGMLYTDNDRKFIKKKKNNKEFDESQDNNLVNNVSLLGKHSFMVYFVHFIAFYLLLLSYKQAKNKLKSIYSQKAETAELEGDPNTEANVDTEIVEPYLVQDRIKKK